MMRGSCLCGQVAFEADEPLRPVLACHCTQCRKTSGHYWAATSVPHDRFRLIRDGGLRWFASSALARRGFCGTCGASLFWQPAGEGRISIAAGCLDGPTGLQIAAHWHVEDAGDYYAPEAPPAGADTLPETLPETLQGACLCGANRFSLPGPMGAVTACHCTQCRKLSGHYSASFDVEETDVIWQARQLSEYVTPGGGQRGFCTGCGASLYFRAQDGRFSLECGAIANPTGGHLAEHIFVADKGDYYTIDNGLPQM